MDINLKHPIIGESIYEKVKEILDSGEMSGFLGIEGNYGGENIIKLEDEVRDYLGVKYAVVMNSATSALQCGVFCCIKKGDLVVVSPYTMSASVSCVLMNGGVPIFIDIEPETFCIDMDILEKVCQISKIKAVIPVDLFGHPADIENLGYVVEKYGISVIEDAAQALGGSLSGRFCGTMGDCGVLSFNQHKAVTCGEGGVLVTDDDQIARIAMALRNHAESSDPNFGIVGYNYRMCEIEAVIALEQFQRIDEINRQRNLLAGRMTEGLPEGIRSPVVKEGCNHSYSVYGMLWQRDDISRDDFGKKMVEKGISFGMGYMKPLYHLPAFRGAVVPYNCPTVERLYQKEMMITDKLRPPMEIKHVDYILETMREVLSEDNEHSSNSDKV